MGSNLHVIIFRNKIRNILLKSPYFSKLSKLHHEKMIDELEVKQVEAGDVICEEGVSCRSKIFFILNGEITQNCTKIDHRGLFFGEESLDPANA